MTETREIGVGLISVGWMGKLHTRAYQAMPSVYPELGVKCRLVIAADTAPDRVEYAVVRRVQIRGHQEQVVARREGPPRRLARRVPLGRLHVERIRDDHAAEAQFAA